jgi:hypothetical protein
MFCSRHPISPTTIPVTPHRLPTWRSAQGTPCPPLSHLTLSGDRASLLIQHLTCPRESPLDLDLNRLCLPLDQRFQIGPSRPLQANRSQLCPITRPPARPSASRAHHPSQYTSRGVGPLKKPLSRSRNHHHYRRCQLRRPALARRLRRPDSPPSSRLGWRQRRTSRTSCRHS